MKSPRDGREVKNLQICSLVTPCFSRSSSSGSCMARGRRDEGYRALEDEGVDMLMEGEGKGVRVVSKGWREEVEAGLQGRRRSGERWRGR